MNTTPLTTTEKVAEAVLAYYRLADSFPVTINEALAWGETLPPDVQQLIGVLPPHEWLFFPDFKRYLLEKRGISLHAYMTSHLAPREVSHWLLHGDGGIGEGGLI